MIDPQVVFDKLASFQKADEIAEYLQSEGINGRLYHPNVCPISTYMQKHTGASYVSTVPTAIYLDTDGIQMRVFDNTQPMTDFIYKFDNKEYPDLIEEDFKEDYKLWLIHK